MISLEVAMKENTIELLQSKNILEVYVYQLKEKLDHYNSCIDNENQEKFIIEVEEMIDSIRRVLESIKAEYRVKRLLEEIE